MAVGNEERVRAELGRADTVERVCQRAAELVSEPADGVCAVLLKVHEGLRTFGSRGVWRRYYAIPENAGAVGESYTSGRTVVDYPIREPEAAYPLIPSSVMSASVPIRGRDRRPLGVLKLEWSRPVEPVRWQSVAEPAAEVLGERLSEMGYLPDETVAERLVRHALAISASEDEAEWLRTSLRAARDVSGLSTAAGILARSGRPPRLGTEEGDRGRLAEMLRELTYAELEHISDQTHRSGTWYTRGEPRPREAAADPLLRIGVRTLIAIPVAVPGDAGRTEAVRRTLLVLDERVRPVHPTIVGLLELLSAQSLMSYQRLALLDSLRAQARHDPLTGLGHRLTFAERMTRARPGRTALLLLDVDKLREINETRGRAAGDHILMDLAEALQGSLRATDDVYRLGGDEFVAVVEVNRPVETRSIAKRLVNAAHWVGCTVSAGVAVALAGESGEDALRRADTAVHLAKRNGRDRAEFADSTPPAAPTAG